jgi:phospholipid N-methyltransferase
MHFDSTPASAVADLRMFLNHWLRQPRTVGAIAPSSAALAEAMVASALPFDGPVLELGAGTGVFTAALLAAGVAPAALTVVECVPEFAALLRHRTPGARVLACDARQLLPSHFPSAPTCIVSGLPLRAMPAPVVDEIVTAAFDCAAPDAHLVQFSYGLRCPLPAPTRRRLGLSACRMAWVWRNLPPAWVWRFDRG